MELELETGSKAQGRPSEEQETTPLWLNLQKKPLGCGRMRKRRRCWL